MVVGDHSTRPLLDENLCYLTSKLRHLDLRGKNEKPTSKTSPCTVIYSNTFCAITIIASKQTKMTLSTHLLKTSSLLNIFTKAPSLFSTHTHKPPLLHFLQYFSPKPNSPNTQKHHICTSTQCATVPTQNLSTSIAKTLSKKAQSKLYRNSEAGLLRRKLDMCSRYLNLDEALSLYDDALSKKIPLSQHNYNVLLYICSSYELSENVEDCEKGEKKVNLGLRRGFEIFKQMGIDGIKPDEATFTNVARLAAKMEDPEMAFALVKKMTSSGILPKLRSYDPALFGFCKKGEADKAYEVDAHMLAAGVSLEEPQLAALLQVSVDVERGDKVYEMLQRLRGSVRQVSDSTGEIIEEWFKSRAAVEVGRESWDMEKLKEGVAKRGGGWHGEGWLGKGEWKVVKTAMDENGVCHCCGEKLVCIDIDPVETDKFAEELARLACQKEVRASFKDFQEWLRCKGPFDAVIDGANVSLNNAQTFSFFQLNAVVKKIKALSPTKRFPLIILHSSRVVGGPANHLNNKKLLEKWQNSGALYTTPRGSNDDWYWLYAAVSSKCLLVTNDEMRDHLFQLLGTSFFPQWKEKHQLRYTMSREGTVLHMPPPYSIVIQESESGNWHIPMVISDDIDIPRQWLCATRASTSLSSTIS